MTKILAFYLPQFHRVPENDKWWGEGFTEWTAVKGAEKLYENHNQPRIPLNHNYYNLLEHDTMAWQAELMERYHIDGMCIYHYWFENGRRILEKPAENLLKWIDIQMPFCFCWANETWSRTWEKLKNSNAWTELYEPEKRDDSQGILLKQKYGREQDWEEHFQYLLPFFRDERYIKLDGMPVFAILKPDDILSLWNMIHYFNKRAEENGLPGIYVIGMQEDEMEGLDAVCLKQPDYAALEFLKEQNVSVQILKRCPYDEIWKRILNKKIGNRKTYFCGMVDFDTTPRRGKNGYIMEGSSSEKFYEFFKQLYQKSLLLNHEFIFVNAWNEWGEGMYLEPDEKNGYEYLEALRRVVTKSKENSVLENRENFYMAEEDAKQKKNEKWQKILFRQNALLDHWMYLREHHINFSVFFHKYGYKNVAVYGIGKLGKHLLCELEGEDIKVCFGIDRNPESVNCGVMVYSPEQVMPKVDAVVITILDEVGKISRMLSKNMECSMIALEEIIRELV